jgi:hypothetical protein
MKKLIFMLIVMLGSLGGTLAQVPYNKTSEFLKANQKWVLGDMAGLDFSSGKAEAYTMQRNTAGNAAASVSDRATGALLFYSDGIVVMNAQQYIMPPYGNTLTGGGTARQGVCIVPVIGDPNRYYLFSLKPHAQNNFGNATLHYSIVDMTLDSGRGNIDPAAKDILIAQAPWLFSEVMIAIPGDSCDIWLVLHAHSQTKTAVNAFEYQAYRITGAGVETTPVLSRGKLNLLEGTMVVSSDRRMIATCGRVTRSNSLINPRDWGGLEVVRFDPATGKVSDPILLPLGGAGIAGTGSISGRGGESVAFSPDGTKLYADEWVSDTVRNLFQFDIGSHDSATIAASKNSIIPAGLVPGYASVRLRLFNDSIYVVGKNKKTVGIIAQPNASWTSCGFDTGYVDLGTLQTGTTVSNDVVFALNSPPIYERRPDILVCGAASSSVGGRPGFPSYEWSTGATTASVTLTQSGKYWVKSYNFCRMIVDTFTIGFFPFTKPTIQISGDTLSTTTVYDQYQWYRDGVAQPGATNKNYVVTQNGHYRVEVLNANGCTDTNSYSLTNLGVTDMGQLAGRVLIYPNPTRNYITIAAPVPVTVTIQSMEGRKLIVRPASETPIYVGDLAEGLYILKVEDASGTLVKTERFVKLQ